MPETCASALWGKDDSQRSGFHSKESGPQIAGLRFDAKIETKISVPAGTGTSVTVDPSTVVTGVDVVNATSFRVLNEESIAFISRYWWHLRSWNERNRRVPMLCR
jgi:hypothetical protein